MTKLRDKRKERKVKRKQGKNGNGWEIEGKMRKLCAVRNGKNSNEKEVGKDKVREEERLEGETDNKKR